MVTPDWVVGLFFYVMVKDSAYFIQPDSGPGPGVLVLPSFWGLTSSVKKLADDIADEGHTVLVPDLNFGVLPQSEEEAVRHLGEANPDRLASLVLSSGTLLAERASGDSIAIVGSGMGGSLALWASVRLHSIVDRAVSFYGTQQIDFAGSNARYQVHLAETDDYISQDEVAFMQATMGLEDLEIDVHVYVGTTHGFAEPEGDSFDETARDLARSRTIAFLAG
ncbi:MAG TPA: dienelactone hydrolase family protein [Acidimicrobiia bacterium]